MTYHVVEPRQDRSRLRFHYRVFGIIPRERTNGVHRLPHREDLILDLIGMVTAQQVKASKP